MTTKLIALPFMHACGVIINMVIINFSLQEGESMPCSSNFTSDYPLCILLENSREGTQRWARALLSSRVNKEAKHKHSVVFTNIRYISGLICLWIRRLLGWLRLIVISEWLRSRFTGGSCSVIRPVNDNSHIWMFTCGWFIVLNMTISNCSTVFLFWRCWFSTFCVWELPILLLGRWHIIYKN